MVFVVLAVPKAVLYNNLKNGGFSKEIHEKWTDLGPQNNDFCPSMYKFLIKDATSIDIV